jgi:hypothetical protein
MSINDGDSRNFGLFNSSRAVGIFPEKMLLESLTFPLAQSYFCYYFCHSEEADNIDLWLVRTTLADEESLISEGLNHLFAI